MSRLLLLMSCMLLAALFACKSTKSVSEQQTKNQEETVDLGYIKEKKSNSTSNAASSKGHTGFTSLTQYLRTIPSLQVKGTDTNGSVTVIGAPNTLYTSDGPLFVVDRVRVGRDLSSVAALLNPNDIDKISVLKSASQTSFYGADGANGVVVIRTKKD